MMALAEQSNDTSLPEVDTSYDTASQVLQVAQTDHVHNGEESYTILWLQGEQTGDIDSG